MQCVCPWSVVHIPQPRSEKNTGRWPILGLVLAARGDVQCNMLTERGANKSDGWGSGSFAVEWSMTSWRGTDATKRREVCSEEHCRPHVLGRCRPCGACPATNRRDQNPRRGVCSEEQCRPHVVGRCRPCGTCSATNRRSSCHLTAVVVAVVGGRALPPLRSHPRRNRGCGLDEKRKQNRYQKKHRRDWRNAATMVRQAFDDVSKVVGGDTECPLQVCQLSRFSESAHFVSFVET